MAVIFISHRKLDSNSAERLAKDLTQVGHTVWFDEWKIDIGDSIVQRVQEGLSDSAYLVLCCSSFGSSDWVDREWMSALARQLSGQSIKLLPALLNGGKAPAILADIKFADLASDWDQGVSALIRAIK